LLQIMCFTGWQFIMDQRVSRVDNAAYLPVGCGLPSEVRRA
jgi:hypothetical protein